MHNSSLLEKVLKCCQSPPPYSEPQLKVQNKAVPFSAKSKKKKNSISHKISLKQIPPSQHPLNPKRQFQGKLPQNNPQLLPSGRNAISRNVSINKPKLRDQCQRNSEKIGFLWSPFQRVEKMKKKGTKFIQAKKNDPIKTEKEGRNYGLAKKKVPYEGQSTRQKSPQGSIMESERGKLGESKYTMMSGQIVVGEGMMVQESMIVVDYFNPEKNNLLRWGKSR